MRRDIFAQGVRMGHSVTARNLEGLSDAESLQSLGDGNCINWIAGHILWSRIRLCATLGLEGAPVFSEKQSELYKMGSGPLQVGASSMALGDLSAGISSVTDAIVNKLGGMADEEFDVAVDPARIPVPVKNANLEALLTLFLFHEAYHAGQIGLARRVIGKSSGLGI